MVEAFTLYAVKGGFLEDAENGSRAEIVFIVKLVHHLHHVLTRQTRIFDLRNLMAEGYVPVMGQDHRTVYLVPSARSVRGGVAFVF